MRLRSASGSLTIEVAATLGELFGTVGVSENIVDASWAALVDGVEYKLFQEEDAGRLTPPVTTAPES